MKFLNLASNRSFWRGIDCYHEKKVKDWTQVDRYHINGTVSGSEGQAYNVNIVTNHPKQSTCNCAFAEGRRVICKHMVALYLEAFPGKETEMMEYIEAQNRQYELELEQEKQERRAQITKYVKSLKKEELQKLLLERLLDEMEESYGRRYW